MKGPEQSTSCPSDVDKHWLPPGLQLGDWRQAAAAPIFSGLPANVIMEALKFGRLRCFGKSQQVFSPDSRPQAFLLVLKGRIRLFYLDRNGEERPMRFVGPGDLLCPPLEAEPPKTLQSAFGESVENLRLLMLPAACFLQMLQDHFPLARNLISQLATSLEQTCQQACLCQARSAPVLVARYLMERLPEHRDSINLRPICMTAQEMGIARETLSRAIAGLYKRGLINYCRGTVMVLDRPGLRDLASNL
ncbi:Crp/Fnr family transcriptional regulator [Trichloromonas sp.]|uniref:Crp/Fnr family transcriptional regulator n=1 Tax=Trichloromonas sp. TaxID=3069249 RepID=UPI002A48AA7B|nr:Crp/Fnr family transcriptional regulator [Trichloromonas sp.]